MSARKAPPPMDAWLLGQEALDAWADRVAEIIGKLFDLVEGEGYAESLRIFGEAQIAAEAIGERPEPKLWGDLAGAQAAFSQIIASLGGSLPRGSWGAACARVLDGQHERVRSRSPIDRRNWSRQKDGSMIHVPTGDVYLPNGKVRRGR